MKDNERFSELMDAIGYEEAFNIALKDLVKLSLLTNKVITQGSFPGYISDEVQELLTMCENVVNTFTEDEDA